MNESTPSKEMSDALDSPGTLEALHQRARKALLHPERASIFIVGIKGTGTSGLAHILLHRGARISGSDGEEEFYTDKLLARDAIQVVSFSPEELPESTDLIIYSAAYNPESHPQLLRGKELGIPMVTYFQALGIIASKSRVCAVCGTHGKTSTSGLLGTLIKHLPISATTLSGSGVGGFDNFSTHEGGDEFFIVESCEYRKQFLAFYPEVVILTSIEPDHFDSYAKGLQEVESAFLEFLMQIQEGGVCIYYGNSKTVEDVMAKFHTMRPDVSCIPYGFKLDQPSPLAIVDCDKRAGESLFTLPKLPLNLGQSVVDRAVTESTSTYTIRFPGVHTILNATAAIGAAQILWERSTASAPLERWLPRNPSTQPLSAEAIQQGLLAFTGITRRSQLVGESKGILILDDYGHHPTEITTTLEGLRAFYPGRRLILSFMSHTYSRTAALYNDFAKALQNPDILILHKIYGSARERAADFSITGEDLYNQILKEGRTQESTWYIPQYTDALPTLLSLLREGDLFITMGAGDNWQLGEKLFFELSKDSASS